MVKKLLFVFTLVLLLAPLLSATDTEIKIKTMPHHEVHVTLFDDSGGDFTTLGRRLETSDEYGDVHFIYSSEDYSFKIMTFIKKEGKTVYEKKFTEEYLAGTPISLVAVPANFEIIPTPSEEDVPEVNETEEVIAEVIDEVGDVEEGTPITGAAISGDSTFLSTKTLYYVVIILAVLIAMFVTLTVVRRKKTGGERRIKIKKLSELNEEKKEMQEEKKEKIDDYKDIIESAEKKIKEAQEQIRSLKDERKISEHEKKIKEARKKLEEDEKELLKLRQEKD